MVITSRLPVIRPKPAPKMELIKADFPQADLNEAQLWRKSKAEGALAGIRYNTVVRIRRESGGESCCTNLFVR
jgi:hypothetical protein